MVEFTTPIGSLLKVGKASAGRLARLGVHTAYDLLWYFPFRYEDFRQLVAIKDLTEGQSVTIEGTVELIANRRTFRQKKIITEALISDSSGSIRVVWFNQPFLSKTIHQGDKLFLSGMVKADMLGPQLVSPMYEKSNGSETTNTNRLVPIYSVTEGLTQKQMRAVVKQVLPLTKNITEWVPDAILEQYDLIPLGDAIHGIHFPESEVDLHKSTERLKFDELFTIQLQASLSRKARELSPAAAIEFHEPEIKNFVAHLPFPLTKAQKIAAWEILQDIAKPNPMNRLLSGDVGSGKTVVAAMALYSATLNNFQGALMAPTEILAEQHYVSLQRLMSHLPVTIALLTGHQALVSNNQKEASAKKVSAAKARKEIIDGLQKGTIHIVVGTQALLTPDVEYKKLGLVIVDEQHRFGVLQRKLIKDKSRFVPFGGTTQDKVDSAVHFLSMTATPIPRSLGLMLYGDLDVSIINELPPGRKKIITNLAPPDKREKAYAFIREQIGRGRQAFVVCPLIEDGIKNQELRGETNSPLGRGGESRDEPGWVGKAPIKPPLPRPSGELLTTEKKTVMAEYEKLSKLIFPDVKVGYLHGKMQSKEKERVMADFSAKGGSASGGKSHKLAILVSTSVIEVGVDVPNASVMMIEGAENFGLAQLHQFRGRVGRSAHQSYCILFTDNNSPKTLERLRYFEAHSDGFKLAEKDLEIRGPGEVYGVEQSGMQQMRLSKLSDTSILKKARDAAQLVAPDIQKYPALVSRIQEFEKKVHLE